LKAESTLLTLAPSAGVFALIQFLQYCGKKD